MTKIVLILTLILGIHTALATEANFDDEVQSLISIDYSKGTTEERLDLFKRNFLKIHHFTYNYGSKLLFKINEGKVLNGHELNLIHESLSAYLTISNQINEFLKKIRPKTKKSFLKDIQSNKSFIQLKWLDLKSVLLSHYKNTFKVFLKETTLRRIIKDQMNRENYGLGNLGEISDSILNKKYRKNLELAYTLFLEKEDKIEEVKSEKIDKTVMDIKSTIAYKLISEGNDLKDLSSQDGLLSNAGDSINNVLGSITNSLSYGFGSVAGNISWREGHLRDNKKAYNHITDNIKPLDLLLEKRGFVFTDFTIPGNWGHVAVYLGTEKELKEIKMWDHPSVVPFHSKIQEGFTVYQVRRWGLEFVTLKTFMNLDEIAIIRHRNILDRDTQSLGKVYKDLYDQIGKKYDFGFDAMSTNEITCTEIISLSYGDINWPSAYQVGRYTISPDNMAQLVLYKNSPVDFVTYIRATGIDNVDYKDVKGFARVMRYRTKLNIDGSTRFDQYSRKCTPKKVRVQGGLRLKRSCETEWKHHIYEGGAL